MTDDDATLALQITDAMKPLLAGYPRMVQSAVLANLTALWLAGHYATDEEISTAQLREELLEGHVKLIRDMIEPSEQEILDNLIDESAPQ
jgi:hypothetical protein